MPVDNSANPCIIKVILDIHSVDKVVDKYCFLPGFYYKMTKVFNNKGIYQYV